MYLAFAFNPAIATSLPLLSPNTDTKTFATYNKGKEHSEIQVAVNLVNIASVPGSKDGQRINWTLMFSPICHDLVMGPNFVENEQGIV